MSRKHAFERPEGHLSRRQGRKKSYDRMLIVCEGEKTEVNYFEAIRIEMRISSADIKVVPGDYGTSPLQVVQYAIDKFSETKAFDRVYAVFDRDQHDSYHNALTKAAAQNAKLRNDEGRKIPFTAIPSVPNFELWILLHFRDVFAPLTRAEVYSELKKAMVYPGYAKNSVTVYADTKDLSLNASARAQGMRAQFNAHSGVDPYTDVDLLFRELTKVGSRVKET